MLTIRKLILSTFLTIIISNFIIIHASFAANVCRDFQQILAANNPKIPLEPSGLIYLADKQIYIAVSDNYNALLKSNNENYVIFWFKNTGEKILKAYPLLSLKQAKKFKLYDLEGITIDTKGYIYALGSQALHPSKPERDTWYRYQGYRFKLQQSKNDQFSATEMNWIAGSTRRNLREWLISDKNSPWTKLHITARAESENGINVEGLSITPNDNLLIGFRGPIFKDKKTNIPKLLITEIKLNQDITQTPSFVKNYWINDFNSQHLLHQQAIRGITNIPNLPWHYLVLTGTSDTSIVEPFYIYAWDAKSDKFYGDRISLPIKNLVWEGIAINKVTTMKNLLHLNVAVVDDLNACFKQVDFVIKK